MSGPDPATEAVRREVRAVLDEELHGLPAKYRTPLVLCYLQGMAAREAARELGWPEGSMPKRLERGLGLLRERLTRRGLALSGGAFATILAQSATATPVPAAQGHAMVKAALVFAAGQGAASAAVPAPAAALAEGVLQGMALTKFKLTAVVLLAVSAIGTGAGVATYRASPERPPVASQNTNQARGAAPKARTDAPTLLLGEVVAYEKGKHVTLEVSTSVGKKSFEYAIDQGTTEIRVIGGAAAAKPQSDIAVDMDASVWADKDDPKKAARIVANTRTPTAQGKVVAYEEGKHLTIEAATGAFGTQRLEFALGKGTTEIRLLQGAKAIAVGMHASVWEEMDDAKKAALVEVKLR